MSDGEEGIFTLNRIVDNPIYEGFAFAPGERSLLGRDDPDDDFSPDDTETREWTITPLRKLWKPKRVSGNVNELNDFPCISLTIPAFSRRAVDCLDELLTDNGELLPLQSKSGEYYVFNLLTKADVLNEKLSEAEYWCDPPTTAVDIDHFEFFKSKVSKLSIFRIPQFPDEILVTQTFVKRVMDCALNGFEFRKVWPLSKGKNWRSGKPILVPGSKSKKKS